MYNVPPKTDEHHKLELLRYSKSFSKKRIVQVDVVPDYNLLILLTGINPCILYRRITFVFKYLILFSRRYSMHTRPEFSQHSAD